MSAVMPDRGDGRDSAAAESAWDAFIRATDVRKDRAKQRLFALNAVENERRLGVSLSAARAAVVDRLRAEGIDDVSLISLRRWSKLVEHAHHKDWLALLLPAKPGKPRDRAECNEACWDWYKVNFLSRAQPSHAETYRRVIEMAKTNGWCVPSARTLRRRLDAEVPRAIQIKMRKQGGGR